jgi:alpha-D-ribose 1-methylphosphonate 5-triphosphate synthase subunit PhnH
VTAARMTGPDSQQVFRAVLEALARPGTPMPLPREPLKVLAPAVTAIVALADSTTGVCVLENPGDRWADAIATATASPIWPAEMARLVAATRPVSADEIRGFTRGSARAPEDAALVAVGVRDVYGGSRRWTLAGPGVCGTVTVAPQGISEGFVAARAEAVAAYPAGIDVLLVADDGRVVGLPRTTTISEEN